MQWYRQVAWLCVARDGRTLFLLWFSITSFSRAAVRSIGITINMVRYGDELN